MNSAERTSPANAGHAIGAMFLSLFGAAWLIVGNLGYGDRSTAFTALVAVSAAAIFAFSWNRYMKNRGALKTVSGSPAAKRRSRLFNIVNLAQWIAIFVVANLLANLHLTQWVIPAVILIVGLHFLPLASIFSIRSHYITGSVLILIAITYPLFTRQGPQSPVGCYATGTTLWLSALYTLA